MCLTISRNVRVTSSELTLFLLVYINQIYCILYQWRIMIFSLIDRGVYNRLIISYTRRSLIKYHQIKSVVTNELDKDSAVFINNSILLGNYVN